jgi:hypothetical protein
MEAVNKIKDEGDENDDDNGDERVTIHVCEPLLTLQLSHHHMHQYHLSWMNERGPFITVVRR